MTDAFISIETAKDFKIDQIALKKLVQTVMKKLGITSGIIELIFVYPLKIHKLNKQYRKIDKPTDVLSFPQAEIPGKEKIIGSIVVAPLIVKEMGETIEDVVVHGCLHLAGYDHEKNEKEWLEILNKLGED